MSKLVKLAADKRTVTGRKVKDLRNNNLIPGNIFGSDIDSVAIQVSYDEFSRAFKQAGETGIIEVSLGDDKKNVLISEMQIHPVSQEILHIDLREVNLNKKVMVMVPVELVGEAPAEKMGLGVLVQHVNELEVEALPLEFPDKFEIDVTGIESLEDSISVSDIKVDAEKITIQAEPDLIIANVTEIKEEAEPILETPEAKEEEKADSQPAEEKSEAPDA